MVGTQPGGELQLVVLDVDRDHERAGDPGVLQCEVAEPADAEDRDGLRRCHVRDLDGLVRGHTRAAHQRGTKVPATEGR